MLLGLFSCRREAIGFSAAPIASLSSPSTEFVSIMPVDLRAPGWVSHVRPVVFFKARGVAQTILVDVEHGNLLR